MAPNHPSVETSRWANQVRGVLDEVLSLLATDHLDTARATTPRLSVKQADRVAEHKLAIEALFARETLLAGNDDQPIVASKVSHEQRNLVFSIGLGMYVLSEYAATQSTEDPAMRAMVVDQVQQLILTLPSAG